MKKTILYPILFLLFLTAVFAVTDVTNTNVTTTDFFGSNFYDNGILLKPDTNDSIIVNQIVATNCTGQVVAGFYTNGTGYCEADAGAGADTNETTRVDLIIGTYIPNNYTASLTYADAMNVSMKAYVDGQGFTTTTYVDNANASMKAYADSLDHTDLSIDQNINTTGSPSFVNVSAGKFKVAENRFITNQSGNGLWDTVIVHGTAEPNNQLLFAVCGNGTTGTCMPHFWVQNGAGTSASGISRSFMIVNEVVSQQNTTNLTSCQGYMDYAGEELKIDCNTTTTGADLLVGDDMQIVGDVWLKDAEGEWHYTTRSLSLLDVLFDDLFFNKVASSISGGTLTITDSAGGDNFAVNINKKETLLTTNTSDVALNVGTNATPNLNWIHYANEDNPTLTATVGEPAGETALIGKVYAGAGDYTYGSLIGQRNLYEFVKHSYDRFYEEGAIYMSGYSTTSSASELNISSGTMMILVHKDTSTVNLTTDSFYYINSSSNFVQETSIDNIAEYSDGGAIANNKYYNIIWGVVHDDINNNKLVAVISRTPTTEYTNIVNAEVDEYNSVGYFPTDSYIKKTFLPIARTVVQKTAGTDAFQLLGNGLYHSDLRGSVSGAGGSAPSPSISDHGQLDGLSDDDHSAIYYSITDVDTAISNNNASIIAYTGTLNHIDTTIGNCTAEGSCPLITYDTELVLANASMKAYGDATFSTGAHTTAIGNETTRVDLIIGTYIPNNYTASLSYADAMNVSMKAYVDAQDHTDTNETTRVDLIIGTYIPNNYTASTAYTDTHAGTAHGNTTAEIRAQFSGSNNISITNGVIAINASFSSGAHTTDTNETSRVDLVIGTYIPSNYSASLAYTDNANTSVVAYIGTLNHIDTTIGNCTAEGSCPLISYDTELVLANTSMKSYVDLIFAPLDSPTFTTAVTLPDTVYVGQDFEHTGDSNTKMSFTSDQVNYVTGGSTRFTINNAGAQVSNGNLDMNSNDLTEVNDIIVENFINQTITDGITRTFSNGCYEKVNTTGLYFIC